MSYEEELKMFETYLGRMAKTFAAKRHDYGPTSEETFKRFGLVSMVIRMYDKIGRLMNLAEKPESAMVNESVEDTLFDLANYAMITVLEMDKMKANTMIKR